MKKIDAIFVILLILAGFLSTCQKDEMDKLPPINKEEELAVAKQWYHSQFGALMLKSGIADSSRSRVVLKPEWGTARVHHNRRLKTVETVLIPQDTALFIVDPENMEKYEATGDQRYTMSLTRLVVQTHRRSGKKMVFMMTIMPSVKYLEQTNFKPFRKMSYIGRDKKFDGRVLFHLTDGTFCNGWVYRDGKIKRSIKHINSEEEPITSLKSSRELVCDVSDIHYVFRCECDYYMVNGEIEYIDCHDCELVEVEIVLECDYWFDSSNDDEFEEGDEWGGNAVNGGGSITLPPPPQPPNTYKVILNTNPQGSGSVTGVTAGENITGGTLRTITAIPNSGYAFVNWTGSAISTANPYNVTVNSNMSFTANFVNVTLTAPSTITLMDSYNLSVNISNVSVSISSVEYYIGNDKISSCSSTTCNEPARKAGKWSIHAKVTLSNNSVCTSNTVQVTVQYPDISTIMANGTVSSTMASVWAQTKSNASSNGRQEYGFWIFANTNTMIYECGTTILGTVVTSCAPGVGGTVTPGVSGETHSPTPVTGGKYAVAFFHTHTPLTYCTSGSGARTTGASGADISWANSNNMPCILYDYVGNYVNTQIGIGIIAGHNLNDAAGTTTFGPNRRPTPY